MLEAKFFIEENSEQMLLAKEFLHFFNLLHDYCQGDAVSMCHWLRVTNKTLEGIPLLMIVDEKRLTDVVSYLEARYTAT